MADRVVKVRYEALVDGAVANVKKLQKATSDYAERGAERVRKNEQAWSNMTRGLAVGAVATGAALGVMTKSWMGFDKEMSGVAAVAGATTEQMARLEQAAIDLGASTVFSASEVASAQAELVRAGVSVEDMLSGGLKGALDLAAAGGLDLASASVIAAQAMNLFNLEGRDVGHIADVLASGANKSAADVDDLGQALQQAGTVASQTGLSLEETVAALSMFADQGIRGSDAGTSLKTMLQRLTPQSKEAQKVMEELGFSAFDASGEFIGLEGLARELQDSFGGLDTQSRQAALGVAFGSDAIRGAAILMEGGADAAREYEAAMNDTGAAARMASTMTDNLAGDLEELGGAIETALIKGGQSADGALRGITQGLTGLVDAASDAPRWLQETALGLAGVATVGGLGVAGVLKVGTSMVSLGDDIASIAGKSTMTSKSLTRLGGILTGPWGLALVGATAVVGAFAIEQGKARVEANELRETLDEQTGAVTDNTRAWQAKKLQDDGTFERYEKMGGDVRDLTLALEGDAAARERIGVVTQAWADANDKASSSTGGLGVNLSQGSTQAEIFLSKLDGMIDLTDAQAEKVRQLASATDDASGSLTGGAVALSQFALGMADFVTQQQASVGGADLWLSRTEQMILLGEEAVDAMHDWKSEVSGFSSAFISMEGALAANDEKARAWAEGQAEATESAEDSWEDYVKDATFSLDTFLAELEKQMAAQEEWETNILALSGRMSEAAVRMLYEMGPAGAQAAAALVDATDEELARFEAAAEARGATGAAAFADSLYDAGPVLRAAAAVLGQDAADEIAAQIASGETTVAEVVEKYDLGVLVDLGADPTNYNHTVGVALGQAEDSEATSTLNGDPGPFLAELGAALSTTDQSSAMATILGTANPAFAELGWLLDVVSASYASTTTGTKTGPAESDVYGLLGWIGRQWATVNVQARMVGGLNVGGAAKTMVSARAAGGIDDYGRYAKREPMLAGPAYGRTNIMWPSLDGGLTRWAEPETGWEAYISGHPSHKAKNVGVLSEAARRNGYRIEKMAVGGLRYGDVAQHPATLAPASSGPVSVDTGAIASAVSSAMAGWQPMVNIDGRTFRGVMQQAKAGAERTGG